MDTKERIIDCMQRVGIVLPDQNDHGGINLNDFILGSSSFYIFYCKNRKRI